MLVVGKLNRDLDNDPDTNGDEAGTSNLGHDLLQVGDIVGSGNQAGSASEERVGSRGVHNAVALSLLDGRAGKANTSRELLDREGLASEGSLVNLQAEVMIIRLIREDQKRRRAMWPSF